MTALQELLAKVEAGLPWGDDWPVMVGMSSHGIIIMRAYNGSLDAAKALHEAVLSYVYNYSVHRDSAAVMSWAHTLEGKTFTSTNKNPARAWLIAIIKALISEEAK